MPATQLKEAVVTCLECDRNIKLSRKVEVEDTLSCRHCGTHFVVVDLGPVEIDYSDDSWGDLEDWMDDDDWDGEEDDE